MSDDKEKKALGQRYLLAGLGLILGAAVTAVVGFPIFVPGALALAGVFCMLQSGAFG